MERYVLRIVVLILLVVTGVLGVYVVRDNRASTAQIDASVREMKTALTQAETEKNKYSGGLLRVLVDVRVQTLKDTIAMLEQKRVSLLHRVLLQYSVPGSAPPCRQEAQLESIRKDMDALKTEIASDERESSRYEGGLVKALIDMRAETDKESLAMLEQRYLAAKYGTQLPVLPSQTASGSKPGKVRRIVPDKDAL